jgi:hypothetical protein
MTQNFKQTESGRFKSFPTPDEIDLLDKQLADQLNVYCLKLGKTTRYQYVLELHALLDKIKNAPK